MLAAIKAELAAAKREKRNPQTSNVLALFRTQMRPELSERDITQLFDLTLRNVLERDRPPDRVG